MAVGLDDIATALAHARDTVAIATPFLSHPVASLLISESVFARRRRLLVALNEAAVVGGYLDPRAVEAFVTAGYDVRSLRNLHAKLVLADRRWGLVGSGNLTVAGVNGGNAELGVVLSPDQTREAERRHFDPWWRAATPIDLDYLRALERRRPAQPERRQRRGEGGFFNIEPGAALQAFANDPSRSGYWLKIMHYRPERARKSNWTRPMWVSDVHRLRSDGTPLLKPGYAVGDKLVIYLSREGPRACPAIVRVLGEPRFAPEIVARDGWPGDEEHWGWVTDVEVECAVAIDRAPTLSDLGIASSSIRQHSRIRLNYDQFRRALRHIPPV